MLFWDYDCYIVTHSTPNIYAGWIWWMLMYRIKTLSNLQCLKQLDLILLFIWSRNGNRHTTLLVQNHAHTHLSQPFCLMTVHFILQPFSIIYLFFQNNTITLHMWAVGMHNMVMKKKRSSENGNFFSYSQCVLRRKHKEKKTFKENKKDFWT